MRLPCRAGFDNNLRDYLDEHVISHALHHNAFLVVSNGHRARYGSITTPWEHFSEWKRQSDEAHRTQAGKLARNMRLALPNASFIGFTGTPLFTYDNLTKRIFGDYISRYDFKRSEQDKATVKLLYANRGEKLGVAKLDLNDRIAKAIEQAELTPEKEDLLERLMGNDYPVITADDRLDKIAADFVEHCATRWQSGKSMFVCVDKITCARMLQRIQPRWEAKLASVRAEIEAKGAAKLLAKDMEERQLLSAQRERLIEQAQWMGMLKSLRNALAQYALGDDANGQEEIVAPVEERVKSLLEAIEATEGHLLGLGFDTGRLHGAKGLVAHPSLGRCGGSDLQRGKGQFRPTTDRNNRSRRQGFWPRPGQATV